MVNGTEENKGKASWLENLATESWQVEMIASGLAIYGSLALGTQLEWLAQHAVVHFSERTANFLSYVLLYLFFTQTALVVGFVLHLCLRILWVGVLGLSSVYPDGINLESKTSYTPEYLAALKRDHPSLNEAANAIDKMCSVIFSVLCCFVIMNLSAVLWIGLFILLNSIVTFFFPNFAVASLNFVLPILLISLSLFVYLFTAGPLKNSKFGKKHGYKIGATSGRIFMPIGFKYLNLLMQTIRTNITGARFTIGTFAITFLSLVLSFPRILETEPYFNSDNYARIGSIASRASGDNYLDTAQRFRLLDPCIQSSVVEENYLRLFIPDFERDHSYRADKCGIYADVDSLDRMANRSLKASFDATCVAQVYAIAIDDIPQTSLDFAGITHSYNGEKGYEVFIPLTHIDKGNHILSLSTTYVYANGSTFKRAIPFYKAN